MTVTKPSAGFATSPPPKSAPDSRHHERGGNSSSNFTVGNVFIKLVRLIFVLIALAVYCAVVPLFAAFMIPMYIYRGLVIVLQKVFHPDWVCIMNSRDALVGLDDTTKSCHCMIVASICFRGVPDMNKIHEHFQKNVMEIKNPKGEYWYEKLTYYYENWMGFPFWKKEANFKLEDHLRVFDYKINYKKMVDRNGQEEEYVEEDDLMRICGEIETLPFPKGRSPWEILILKNYIPKDYMKHKAYIVPAMNETTEGSDDNEDKYFTLVYRVHHGIGDGFSFMKMLVCDICDGPLESVPRPPPRKFSFWITILNNIGVLIFTPYYHFQQFFVQIDRSIWHLSSNKLTKQSHFVTTERVPMESLKMVGKAHKVPLTGVMLAGLAGGIHNFLKLTGKGHRIPKCMRALSPMPWENHPAFNGDGLVNHWTVGVFEITVGEDTPQKRLRASKAAMRNLTQSPILISNFLTVPLLLSAPNFLTDIWGTNWMTSMILSNFPGPKVPCKGFGKYPMDNIITFVPHMRGSAGLGVMFPTTFGNARCTISIDKAILKDYSDAQLLIGLIDEEFRILQTLCSPYGEMGV